MTVNDFTPPRGADHPLLRLRSGRTTGTSADQHRDKRRGGRSESRVIDAAADLFSHRGFVETRVDDIAAAAHISKPWFYVLFGTKLGVYHAVLERETAFMTQLVVGPLRRHDSADLNATSARILARLWYLQRRRPTALPLLLGPLDWRLEGAYKARVRLELKAAVERCLEAPLAEERARLSPSALSVFLVALAVSTSDLLREGRANRAGAHRVVHNAGRLFPLR